MGLRDYQQKAWDDAWTAFKSGRRAPVIVLPTGTGKGTLIASIAISVASKGKRVIITAPREEIAKDLIDRIAKMGGQVGGVAPWAPNEPDKLIQVAMAPTLANRWQDIEAPDLVIVDECHHSPANGYLSFLHGWSSAARLGFTATPCRLDGQGLGLVFDSLVLGPPPKWFVDNGYLTDFDYFAPFEPDLKDVRSRNGDYEIGALEEALERSKVFGNAVKEFQKLAPPNGTGVVFCCSKRHAELVAQAFNDAGIPAEILLGEDQGEVRKGKLARLAAGITRIICAVDVISEGFDLPSIDVVILLRPTHSLSLFLQQVGRVLRTIFGEGFDLDTVKGRLAAIAAGPKPRAVIIDCAGNYHRHGHPLDERTWSLDGDDPEARKQTHTEDGVALSTRRCDECLQVYQTPATLCPYCGTDHGPDPRVPAAVAAELRRVERQEREKEEAQAKAAVTRERFYQGMVKQMKRNGAKKAKYAAFHRLHGRALSEIEKGNLRTAADIGADLVDNGFGDHVKMALLRTAYTDALAAQRAAQ